MSPRQDSGANRLITPSNHFIYKRTLRTPSNNKHQNTYKHLEYLDANDKDG